MPPEAITDESDALPENRATQAVWDRLAAQHPDRPLTLDSDVRRDLGIDSMGWLDLALELRRRVGVGLSDAAIARTRTVRDLLREVAAAGAMGEQAFGPSVFDAPEAHLADWQRSWLAPPGPSGARLARRLYAVNRAIMRGLYRLRVDGLDRLPERWPVVFTPTHGSYLDPPALAAALDDERLRRTFWGEAASVLFANPLMRGIGRLAQAVPVDAGGVLSSVAFAAAVLQRGNGLVWFPEGRRARTADVEAFRPGIGVLLERFSVPVVPVAIHGTREAWPPGRRLPRLHPVRVVFGEPLDPGGLERQGAGARGRDRITGALQRRVTELYRRTAPDAGGG